MADDFEQIYSGYRTDRTKTTEPVHGDQNKFLAKLVDITQETHRSGDISQVYLTSENLQSQMQKKARFGNVSLVLRRVIPSEKIREYPNYVQLEIQSDTLREAFRDIATGLVNINLYENPIKIPQPYVEIYHCRKRIQEAIESNPTGPLKNELRLLQEFEEQYLPQTLGRLYTFERNGLITTEFIPFVFNPGCLVLLPNRFIAPKEAYWAAIVVQCRVVDDSDSKYWEVQLAYTNSNDGVFGIVVATVRNPLFRNIQRIIDLPVFPLRHHPDRKRIYELLLRRGAKYKTLFQESVSNKKHESSFAFGSHCKYDGQFFEIARDIEDSDDEDEMPSFRPPNRRRIDRGRRPLPLKSFQGFPSSNCVGRIVLDPVGLAEENSSAREDIRYDISGPTVILLEKDADDHSNKLQKRLQMKESDASDVNKSTSAVTDLQLVTMPPIIAGFSLAKRCWGYFLIDDISEIEWSNQAYDDLRIDESKKASIRKILEEHRSAPVAFDDIIPGKGTGLVFLLHGPPGSGKTMTAETAAESLRCPLYYTTGGELGHNTNEVVERLELMFRRIQRWAAILLFDEADVFMATRREDNIERNALVSILLRTLEYQSGILFLTTNRVSDFDTAFYSRIHIRIEFYPPDETQRTFIWKRLASQLQHDISQDEFKSLGLLEVDGRRIKNVLKVASLLMRSRGKEARLSLDDVKSALHISAGDPNEMNVEKKVRSFAG
ncbi:hypothetical protein F5Y04DRAFT_246801 [Hypomontagnella monticulosa]|nr:hypothetical protein F5Y04DRAFT_246801 [Hypomontagnella monticulosa]